MHEEGAHWRVVNWHGSIAVTNEAVWGHSQTTSVEEILALVQDYETPTAALAIDGVVAIVFTDVVGSSALMEEIGEQRWISVLNVHSDSVRRHTAVSQESWSRTKVTVSCSRFLPLAPPSRAPSQSNFHFKKGPAESSWV